MTLATLLAHFVDWRVRERGRQYFQTGKVQIVSAGPEDVEAMVSGGEEYRVSLRREEANVWVFCSCAFFEGGEPCKHVWATVLAADERKALRGSAGDLPRTILMPGAAQERIRPVQTWRDSLAQLAASPAPHPAPSLLTDGREILYLLDVPDTLKRQQLTVRAVTGRRQEDGSWQAITPLSLRRDDVPQLPEPDRTLLSLLSLAAAESPAQRWSVIDSSAQVPAVAPLSPAAARLLVPQLGATDRFWTRPDRSDRGESKIGAPVVWDAGPPWDLWLEAREEEGGGVRLAASLRRGEERLPAEPFPLALGGASSASAPSRTRSPACRRCRSPPTACPRPCPPSSPRGGPWRRRGSTTAPPAPSGCPSPPASTGSICTARRNSKAARCRCRRCWRRSAGASGSFP